MIDTALVSGVLLPASLGIIMLGLGMTLHPSDFARILRQPKAVLIGLGVQMLLLTAICFGLCLLLKLPPELAVGMMLLAAAPGGASANIYSHLAGGDVALNITLTAVNSLLCLLSLPLIVGFSLAYFMAADQAVPPPFGKIIEVGLIILVPVAIGMGIRRTWPQLSDRVEKPLRLFSVLLLALLVVLTMVQQWRLLAEYAAIIGLACVLFNVLSLLIGYAVPLALKLPRRQAIAIAMEIGIHNGTLALFIAFTVLENSVMAVPAAFYSISMFITAGLFAAWLNRPARAA
ncbi:bile acid:sodium symporter family protein [Arenimonas sp.]|jgi:BASS family bile acid:Na+ symporter|uniref:bile acid:sodium symporter family protein n=1 Tax=Arenimonas sp. TaxID=1872635 RepID=UPI0037C04409